MGFIKIILFFNAVLWAGDIAFPTAPFESLTDFTHVTLKKNTPTLLYFFQPECSSCTKQKKDLQCLSSQFNVVTIGVFGSKRALAKEAQKHQLKGTLLFGGKRAEELFAIRQTPTLLFFDRNNKLLRRADHWMSCEQLGKIKLDLGVSN